MTLAPWVSWVRQSLHLKPYFRGANLKRQVASRCAYLWRKKWLSKRQAEAVKRLTLEGLS